ncbi:histidine kinase [Arthrobacter sp. efr-133-TYG-118]|uniref:sensor histidine kinase n=1 Tax=Arthrobacter sp. efr-133-TYG-118 TaxID=3040279 RepID=UPI00254CF13B|nr:histidine kinase [Arthrobacter sp. efr-133-TYG-118]
MMHYFPRGQPVDLRLWIEILFDAIGVASVGLALRGLALESSGAVGYIILGIAAVAFAARRWLPLTSVTATAALSLAAAAVGQNSIWMWLLTQACLVTVGMWRRRRTALVACVTVGSGMYISAIWADGQLPLAPYSLLTMAWTACMAVTGIAIRLHHDYIWSLHERALALEHDQARDLRQKVIEERIRIARDLHDAVAHNVTVISVHAGSAERQLDRDPARARASLVEIRDAARSIITEIEEVLRILRDDQSPLLTSLPRLAELEGLVQTYRELGLDLVTEIQHLPEDIPETVDLAIYRLVQEGLTNAHRHGSGTATLKVWSTPDELFVEIVNPVGQSPSPHTTGWGLIGMRERMASVDGTLLLATKNGSYTVRAEIPLARVTRRDRP